MKITKKDRARADYIAFKVLNGGSDYEATVVSGTPPNVVWIVKRHRPSGRVDDLGQVCDGTREQAIALACNLERMVEKRKRTGSWR